MGKCALWSCIGFALLGLGGPASANRLDIFGGGARGQAMGGAGGALIDDHSALYFNPAMLSLGAVSVGLSVDGAYDRTAILLMPRPSGYDPLGYADRIRPRRDLDAARKNGSFSVGIKARPYDEDLTIAVMVLGSFEGLGRISTAFADEREQFFSNQLRFELLGARTGGEMFAVGGAFRLRPWISIGLGVLLMPDVTVSTQVLTPNPTDPSEAELNYDVRTGFLQALTAGVVVEPTAGLRFGVSFQDALNLRLQGGNTIQLAGVQGPPVQQTFDVAQSYSPLRITASTSYAGAGGWRVALDSTWRAWSRYLDHHATTAGFEDTFDLKLGLEMPFDDRSVLRLGGGYVPSPVPSQTGRSNYVDNDRVVGALGGGRKITLWGETLELGISVQFQGLVSQTTRKAPTAASGAPQCGPTVTVVCDETPDRAVDTPGQPAAATHGLQTGNPGFPGFTHGGYLVSAGLEVVWRY